MDQFVEFLRVGVEIVSRWSQRDFRRVRDSLLIAIAVVLFFIVPGAFLGEWSWAFKAIWLWVGLIIAAVTALSLAYYRIAAGAVAGMAVSARQQGVGLVQTPVGGFDRYLRFVAAFLASEYAVGFIVLWLPAHQNPVMALWLLPVGITLLAYTIWKRGEMWWPKLVKGLALFTLGVSLAAILMPQTVAETMSRQGAVDQAVVALIRGDASPQVVFWGVVLFLAALGAAVPLLRADEKQKRQAVIKGLARGCVLIVVALLISWFIWGAGWDKVAPHVGAAAPSEKLVVTLRDGKCVDVAMRLPARGVIDWDTRRAVNPQAVFNDGSKLPLRGDLKGRGNVAAVCGEGVVAARW